MSKKSIKLGRTVDTVVTYIILIVVAFIFFFPCLWLILASFSESGSIYSFQGFFPSAFSFRSFVTLFTDTAMYDYPNWFKNTLFIAVMACILGTFLTILTAYCETRNVLHINVMHGEKMYYIRDSYFRYDRCYVWDAYYRDLFISMNAAPSQFIIALPPSMKINCAKHVNEGCYAYYKYFLTSQTKEQLVSISNSLQSLLMHGRKVKYRLHPRYSDRELVKQIVGKENVEYPEKVSILDSISNMDTAIGLYTTVLNQAYHCGKNVIIDDVTYPSEVKKLEEFKYIMIHKKLPLLSELIKK